MSTPHTLLELRTGRRSEQTPEVMVQFFSSLPSLENSIFRKLRKTEETFALEIVVENQTISFQMFAPTRLVEYIKSLLVASYPEVLIEEINRDPLAEFTAPPHQSMQEYQQFVTLGSLRQKQRYYLPLKTYAAFAQSDPLSPLLSLLSQLEPLDKVAIQFAIDDISDSWKKAAPTEKTPEGVTPEVTDSHEASLIKKKLEQKAFGVTIKIAVNAALQERSTLLLESVAGTFQAFNESNGNQLILKKAFFRQPHFFEKMSRRSQDRSPKLVLSVDELATLYHLPNKDLAAIPNIAWGKRLLGEPPEKLPIITRESTKEQKKDINLFARAMYKNHDTVYGISRKDRRRHLYVIGKTGTGKSTLLANMGVNDLKNDEGLCVIDPHGDLVETLLDYIPSRRINDVIYLDPSDPERTVQINLFEGENVVHRELIASGIVSVFKKLYGYSWGPRLEYILRNSLLTLLKSEDSRLSDILNLLTDDKFRKKVVDKLDDPIIKSFWIDEFNKLQERQRHEQISSILNKVGQFVSSPLIRNVVNARKSSFSIEEVMDQGKILLVNLSQGKLGEDNATLLGSMIITKIQLAAMARVYINEEDRKDFFLYVDEFQNFATDSFAKILSEARKYRLNLTLANQYIAQIPEEVQKAIFGNCGSMVSFVMGAEDAHVFSKEFGDAYSIEDLVSLNRYQIINRLSIDNIISRPFPAQTLPLAKSKNQQREKVLKVSRERYAKRK